MYDLLIKNGRVIDPVNGVDGIKDIAIEDRRIVRVEEDIPAFSASEVLDVCGKTVIPGLVDIHTHLSPSTSRYSHRMLALAGVTAALDMSGPIDGVLRLAREEGAGLTVASIEALVPGANIPGLAPDSKDIEKALDEALDKGSLGIKLLAAAYLLEPDSIGNAFRIAN
ncbi:MAG: amidohydrolase, partial [Firmicutes bacterium]|nr:amidohydrolase [Bacillota bacterium]